MIAVDDRPACNKVSLGPTKHLSQCGEIWFCIGIIKGYFDIMLHHACQYHIYCRCSMRRDDDSGIGHAPDLVLCSARDRQSVIGRFQYLDHLAAPSRFLEELFVRADSAAIIIDGTGAPVAIQHVTGWTNDSFAFIPRAFGKCLYGDFIAILPSSNRLFLMHPVR